MTFHIKLIGSKPLLVRFKKTYDDGTRYLALFGSLALKNMMLFTIELDIL